ncbi:MAG: AMP-binding protein [Granulosicoccaceae bacterium]
MSTEYAPQAANYVQLTPLSFLQRSATVFPQRLSIVYGDRSYTWKDTLHRCQRLASALGNIGIQQGDTVAVLAFNTPELFEVHFGVPFSGAVLNTINTRLDDETVSYILGHGEAKAIIVDAELLPVATLGLKALGSNIPIIVINDSQAGQMPVPDAVLTTMDYESFLQTGSDDFVGLMPSDEWQSLSLNYTSGTTGRPKGVLYHHRGSYLMSMGTIAGWQMPMHPVYLYSVPMFHCNGWGHAWTLAALAGTCVCLRQVDARVMFDLMETYQVTHFGGAPIVLNMLANAPDEHKKQFDREINVMTAGAPPPASVLQSMNKLGFKVIHVYGLTETFGHVLMAAPQKEWDQQSAAEQAELHARQGVCFPMSEAVDVLAGDPPKPVAHNGKVLGEIVLRGNTIMKGYLDNPEATNEAMHDGWFWTGDLAVVHADGYVQIKDRAKDIIISGGENISSVEIENALYKHEAVAEAAVVAMPDEEWGESPCAFVTLREGFEVTEQEIIDHVGGLIARFKRPKRVVFGALPKTATGKIQKYALRQTLQEQH